MNYIYRRDDSSVWQFKMRTPTRLVNGLRGRQILLDIPPVAGTAPMIVSPTVGQFIKFSLKTKDETIAAARAAAAVEHLSRRFAAAEAGPVRLDLANVVALSRDVYDLYIGLYGRDPGQKDVWIAAKAFDRATYEGRIQDAPMLQPGEVADPAEATERFGPDLTSGINELPASDDALVGLERRYGLVTDWILTRRGIDITPHDRKRLLEQVARSAWQAARELKKRAGGDFSPDPDVGRFPSYEDSTRARSPATKVSLRGLVDLWWAEARAASITPRTYKSYRITMEAFIAFLGHDDATRVARKNVNDFKAYRLQFVSPRTGRMISPKTVLHSNLVALKRIFRWAVDNDLLPENPADGVTLSLGSKTQLRDKEFTDDEARAILASALAYRGTKREMAKTTAAKRWVPWLCAFTGARVGEMAQLRKHDVFQDGEQWVIRITPAAGPVKNNKARIVPLHPQLIEMGFTEFAMGSQNGRLFVNADADGDVSGKVDGVTSRIVGFVRETIKDMNVDPNHAWRHRFKTIGREVGVDSAVLDAIQGHKPRTVGEDYGRFTIPVRARAIALFPRVEV
ncbi:MAG TPA: tyrosine-type recombinase/integrase [Microvirga sp.]|nr:tyrosine-type recombinase/integrase [Microvirga sp.]